MTQHSDSIARMTLRTAIAAGALVLAGGGGIVAAAQAQGGSEPAPTTSVSGAPSISDGSLDEVADRAAGNTTKAYKCLEKRHPKKCLRRLENR